MPDDPEWIGMFWGALYPLTAWNSYDRDDDHHGADIAAIWKDVIDAARGTDCQVTPNWHFEVDTSNCEGIDNHSYLLSVRHSDECETVYHFAMRADGFTDNTLLGLRGYLDSGFTEAGGHVRYFNATYISVTPNPTFELDWTDCLNNDHHVEQVGGSPHFFYSDFEAQCLCIRTYQPIPVTPWGLVVTMVTDGLAICEAA